MLRPSFICGTPNFLAICLSSDWFGFFVYSISVAGHLDLQYASALAASALQLYVLRESSCIFANPLRRQSGPLHSQQIEERHSLCVERAAACFLEKNPDVIAAA